MRQGWMNETIKPDNQKYMTIGPNQRTKKYHRTKCMYLRSVIHSKCWDYYIFRLRVFSGLLVFYLFGPLDLVYRPSSRFFMGLKIIKCLTENRVHWCLDYLVLVKKSKLKYLQPISCYEMGVKHLTSGSFAGLKVQSSI